jgi:hypothetical protein
MSASDGTGCGFPAQFEHLDAGTQGCGGHPFSSLPAGPGYPPTEAQRQHNAAVMTQHLISKCCDVAASTLDNATTLCAEMVTSINAGDAAKAGAAATGMMSELTLTQASVAALQEQVRRLTADAAAPSSSAAASSSGAPSPQVLVTTYGLGAASGLSQEQQKATATAAADSQRALQAQLAQHNFHMQNAAANTAATLSAAASTPTPMEDDTSDMNMDAEAHARGITVAEAIELHRRGELN